MFQQAAPFLLFRCRFQVFGFFQSASFCNRGYVLMHWIVFRLFLWILISSWFLFLSFPKIVRTFEVSWLLISLLIFLAQSVWDVYSASFRRFLLTFDCSELLLPGLVFLIVSHFYSSFVRGFRKTFDCSELLLSSLVSVICLALTFIQFLSEDFYWRLTIPNCFFLVSSSISSWFLFNFPPKISVDVWLSGIAPFLSHQDLSVWAFI